MCHNCNSIVMNVNVQLSTTVKHTTNASTSDESIGVLPAAIERTHNRNDIQIDNGLSCQSDSSLFLYIVTSSSDVLDAISCIYFFIFLFIKLILFETTI